MRVILTLLILALLPMRACASADPRAIAVLATEQQWLRAIAGHDATALSRILSESFVHINYRGQLQYRDDALRMVKQSTPYTQATGDQTVDFAGNVAIVRGINSIRENGRIVMRLRYTDVFESKNGRWLALSAQETSIR